jgi:hypothetical protein
MVAFFDSFVRYPSFFGSSQKRGKTHDNKGLKGGEARFLARFLTQKQQSPIKAMT